MSNKKILLRSRKTVIMNTAIGIDSAPHKNVMVAPHVFLGLNAIGRMEVMEGFYTVYHVRSYKEKEGYFPEEYIKRIETFFSGLVLGLPQQQVRPKDRKSVV